MPPPYFHPSTPSPAAIASRTPPTQHFSGVGPDSAKKQRLVSDAQPFVPNATMTQQTIDMKENQSVVAEGDASHGATEEDVTTEKLNTGPTE